MKAMLLAAGMGTRFRPHTDIVAKPALPFLNLPLFSYPLFHLRNAGLTDLVVNTHHLPKSIQATLASYADGAEFKTQILHEEPEILSSGGGLANAKSLLETDEHFFVINADEVFFFQNAENLKKIYAQHIESGALATLLTIDHPEAGLTFGGMEVKNNRILALGTKTRTENTKHFTGIFIFSKRIFDFMPAKKVFHIFDDVLTPAIARGEKIYSYYTKDMLWLDVTSEQTYLTSTLAALRQMWAKTSYGKQIIATLESYKKVFTQPAPNVWLGSRSEIHCQISDEALVLVGDGSIIHRPVGIQGFAVFGSNVTYDQGFIENSVIAAGVHAHEMIALRNQLLLIPEFANRETSKSPQP